MKKCNIIELRKECEIFQVTPPTNQEIEQAKADNRNILIPIVGVYDPIKEELHPWSITPSSEDKGYSWP